MSRYVVETCPYCQRPLAEFYDDATSIDVLHPKAALTMNVPLDGGKGRPVEGTAKCYRPMCRLRRWLAR